MEPHRRRLAEHFRCDPEEVAITRNTTEGLNIVAQGLDFERGDEVLISSFDHEYTARALQIREARHGVVTREVPMPVPCRDDEVVQRFKAAITSRTRLIAVSHVADGFGFVLPVRRLSQLSHDQGIPILADGALSFGHLVVDVGELGCDFYASSLHKWLGAPLGTGLLFVKRERLTRLWPLYGGEEALASDARKFERIGTRSGPTVAAIGQALDFYEAVGPKRKEARLRYLLNYLIDRLAEEPRVRFITDLEAGRRTSLARVTIQGWTGPELETAFRERFGIRVWGHFGDEWDGIYVSPNLFNLPPQLDRFIRAVRELATERR
jgi:selenocysteine lyase/cysteine desulfurase